MWLWVIDDRTIISAFTEQMASNDRSLFQFLERSFENFTERVSVSNSESSLPTSKFRPANILIQEFVSRCTNFLDRPNLAGFADPLFGSFDNEIGGVSEKVTKKYIDFRLSLESDEDEIRDTVNIKITRESELLLDIRDVRDELSMVRNVFCQQRDVLEDMNTELSDSKTDIHSTVFSGSSCIPRVSKFLRRLQLIDENAEIVERAIQHLLDLKQKQANLKEACIMADQTGQLAEQVSNTAIQVKSTSKQGNLILAFTVVTVFFTPLSWVSAVFAVDLDGGKTYKSWQVVLGEFGSLLFTIIIVCMAFLLFDRGSNK
jgi:Mg2+ and Co2+ transporter CorA